MKDSPSKFINALIDGINFITVPLRLIIPQPVLAKIPVLRTNRDERFRMVLSELTGRTLDIGCGENQMIKRYRENGNDGLGVDVFAWEGPDLIVSDTAHLPFEDFSFDSISFVACLNHIPNRDQVIHEAHRLLTVNGIVVLTNLTPIISRIWHKIAYWDDDQNVRGMSDGEVWGFSHDELLDLFKRHGFELVKKSNFMWGLNHLYVFKKI